MRAVDQRILRKEIERLALLEIGQSSFVGELREESGSLQTTIDKVVIEGQIDLDRFKQVRSAEDRVSITKRFGAHSEISVLGAIALGDDDFTVKLEAVRILSSALSNTTQFHLDARQILEQFFSKENEVNLAKIVAGRALGKQPLDYF